MTTHTIVGIALWLIVAAAFVALFAVALWPDCKPDNSSRKAQG